MLAAEQKTPIVDFGYKVTKYYRTTFVCLSATKISIDL
jgi:hypothetical protein